MRRGSVVVIGVSCLALTLSGCATPDRVGAAPEADDSAPGGPLVVDAGGADPVALEQAQAWREAANLPPEAISADSSVARFSSYTGWPCGPIEELEAFWEIPGATVTGTANWLRENPTADLISTAGPLDREDPTIDSATVGYIPTADSQEGIVYTIAKIDGGVAVRAEIAALTESAVCPTPPDGGIWGPPGQG